jgi:hypothetical protein
MGGVGAPWEAAMGSSPERGKRGKEKRRQGAAWGAARGGEGAPWGLRAARSCVAMLLVVFAVREKKKRRKEKGEEKEKEGKEKGKKRKNMDFF